MSESEATPVKRTPTKLLVLAFLAGFFLVELGVGLDFYFHEANHNNEGLDVLLSSLGFALVVAVPAGIIVCLLAWAIQTWRLHAEASKP